VILVGVPRWGSRVRATRGLSVDPGWTFSAQGAAGFLLQVLSAGSIGMALRRYYLCGRGERGAGGKVKVRPYIMEKEQRDARYADTEH